MKNREIKFLNEWQVIREQGAKRYIFSKMLSVACMMILIYIVNILVSEDTNYLVVAIIYIAIIIIAPIASWSINERRYCKYIDNNDVSS